MADRKHGKPLEGAGGSQVGPPQKCVVTLFAARGSPGGALRRGPRGPFGIAAVWREAPGPKNFQGAPRAP